MPKISVLAQKGLQYLRTGRGIVPVAVPDEATYKFNLNELVVYDARCETLAELKAALESTTALSVLWAAENTLLENLVAAVPAVTKRVFIMHELRGKNCALTVAPGGNLYLYGDLDCATPATGGFSWILNSTATSSIKCKWIRNSGTTGKVGIDAGTVLYERIEAGIFSSVVGGAFLKQEFWDNTNDVHKDVSDNQNIWYLDTVNGLDSNSGLSRSAPKKTGDAVVIACKTAGKTTGRLVVMAGSSGVVFNATTWSNTAFPFFDVVVESFFSTIEFNSAMPTDLNFRGGIVTFNSCQIGGDSCIDVRKIELNGGGCYSLYDSQIILRGSESIKTNGFIAQNTTFESPLLTIDALGLRNRCNIHCGKINGTGTIFNSNNEVLFLDLYVGLFAFEGNFQFASQLGNSWVKITAAKMQRTTTTKLLYLGAEAGVTVNYQLIVDQINGIAPVQIGNPAGTVAGKVIELLKYENKVDAEIIRATAAEALKADLVGGTVPPSQLPSYVDDVVDAYVVGSTPFASDWLSLTVGGTALTPESGKIYIILTAGIYEMLEFRWSGTVYGEISKSIALGETLSTAYRGDRGKTAYDHSLLTSGNPHGVTKSDVGLGNVDNVSDANKPVSTATQAALDLKANQTAISNIDNTSDANKPVSTATQTALDLKANKLTTVNNSTDTAYTFLASDANTCHIVNTSAATTRTVPSDTTAPDIAIGDSIEVQNIGTGVVTFVASSGVTIRSSLTLVMYGQYSVCMLRKIAANTWVLTGERTAV